MNTTATSAPYDGRAAKYLSDNRDRYRAMSILHGFVPDPLPATAEEAADVIRWHETTRPH